ncbi:MAG: hypothetical protein KME30_04320 [Iphinoe sp. HA4291-MV1]|jgi:hypothetical protein|nr:hypothetical protein [Iphinoe sp. HA4291-MV1]
MCYFSISPKVIAGDLVALLGVGLLIGYSIRETAAPQAQQGVETKQ